MQLGKRTTDLHPRRVRKCLMDGMIITTVQVEMERSTGAVESAKYQGNCKR